MKSILFFGTDSTTTASYTVPQPSGTFSVFDRALNTYDKCNVLINLSTLTGSGTLKVSVQERFSGAGFIETALSGVLSAKGNYWLNRQDGNGTLTALELNGFAALGSGMDKQVVFTASSLTAVSADVYFVFYS